jgi:adenosylcobinamide-phosphate synthase
METFFVMSVIDLILAVMLDLLIGDPYCFPHPVIYIGKLISKLEKIGRKICKNYKQMKIFGGIIVVLVALCSFLLPFIILQLSKEYFWL